MKRSSLFALTVLLLCVPVFAGSVKNQYKVKASGGTTNTAIGDSLELSLSPDSIKAVDKTACAVPIDKSSQYHECPAGYGDVIAAEFTPASVTEIVAGDAARFVGITWNADGQKVRLIFDADKKDFPIIVELLEQATGKKAISADTQTTDRPRVFLRSASYGKNMNAMRDQSMEMATDFRNVCPTVLITINEQRADFTIQLNHIEVSFSRDNQVEIYNKDGDLISGKEGGSIAKQVKSACALITTEWTGHGQ